MPLLSLMANQSASLTAREAAAGRRARLIFGKTLPTGPRPELPQAVGGPWMMLGQLLQGSESGRAF